jgi:hypothetical protein
MVGRMSHTNGQQRLTKPPAPPMSTVSCRLKAKQTLIEIMKAEGLTKYADGIDLVVREAAERRGGQPVSEASVKTIKVADVVFRADLYPRIETSATQVQKYAEDLSVLPPIEVNQNNELIDGWHRWTAHKKNNEQDIAVVVTKTNSDAHLLELAIECNAKHGMQLSQADKKKFCCHLYTKFLGETPSAKECAEYKERLAKMFSVSLRTVSSWTSRADKEAKEERNNRIFSMWLACHTLQEIAEKVGLDTAQVMRVCCEMADLPKLNKPTRAAAEHATDFEPPIYNIWKQQTKSEGASHFGNSEVRWLDNLLYLYTEPFDVVVDPFAGGGSTIDICKKRLRRYFVSDRKPVVERETEIRQHDLCDGLPKPPQWKDVRLVYLDPPYWKQAEGQYSNDLNDLANMPLDQFNSKLAGIINEFGKKLSKAHIALIIQPTQWKAPDRAYTDHVADMLRAVKLPLDMRYSAPYESQQNNAQMVNWAKENKRCLVLTREIVVWKVGG